MPLRPRAHVGASSARRAASGATPGETPGETPGGTGSPATPPSTSVTPTPDPRAPLDPPSPQLAAGERPPQLVIVSSGGAGSDGWGDAMVKSDLDLGRRADARFTFFLSGVYLVPSEKRNLYRPPRKPVGYSAIGFSTLDGTRKGAVNLRQAWADGHEIGTHFNGHFCDTGGIDTWSRAAWAAEITTFKTWVDNLAVLAGEPDAPPLGPDSTDILGGRTPCLAGKRSQMLPAFAAAGFRNRSAYPNAVKQFVATVCVKPDVRCVSDEDLVSWLDAMDPAVLAALQALPPATLPKR